MNWEAIGAVGELASAVAVIVTLVYVAMELRRNTRASKIAAIQAASENSSRFSELVAADPELGELVWRGLRDPEALAPAEARRFIAALNVFLRRESVCFYLHKEGLMPDELWEARVQALTGTLNQPGTRFLLKIGGSTLPADFRQFLEETLARPSTLSETGKRILGAEDHKPG